MLRMIALAGLTMMSLSPLGCGESHDPEPSTGTDAGMLPGVDSGTVMGTDGGTSTSDGGSPGTDGSVPTDDGGTVGTDAGGPGSDGGVGGSDGGSPGVIDCLGMSCNAATEQCCVTGSGSGPMGSCIPVGDTCEGAMVTCDERADCGASEVCCARGGIGGLTAACEDEGDGCGGLTSYELCATASDCTDSRDECCPLTRLGLSSSYCARRCF